MKFERADDVYALVISVVQRLRFDHINPQEIVCLRSYGSKARAYARIWGLSRVFQIGFGYQGKYVIEVLSQYFDRLSEEEKVKTLIHELLHIPQTFSGALLSHRGRFHRINKRKVEKWYRLMK